MHADLLTMHQFKALPFYEKIRLINDSAIYLEVYITISSAESALYAYHDFYIELIVQNGTNEILEVKAFKSGKRLAPYLPQVDIDEITILLSYS